MNDIYQRITEMTDLMETFARNRGSKSPDEQFAIIETIALAKTIRINKLTPAEICDHLRNTAIEVSRTSPAITEYMKMIAREFDQLNPKETIQ